MKKNIRNNKENMKVLKSMYKINTGYVEIPYRDYIRNGLMHVCEYVHNESSIVTAGKKFDTLDEAKTCFEKEKEGCIAYSNLTIDEDSGYQVEVVDVEYIELVECQYYSNGNKHVTIDTYYGLFCDVEYFRERINDYLDVYKNDILYNYVEWEDSDSVTEYYNEMLSAKNDPLNSTLFENTIDFAVEEVHNYMDSNWYNPSSLLNEFIEAFDKIVWSELQPVYERHLAELY